MPRDYITQPPTAHQRRSHLTRDDDWIRAFLKVAQIGHIASSVDGQPFINPTMFWLDEVHHQIVFHSNVAGRIRSNSCRLIQNACSIGKNRKRKRIATVGARTA